MSLRSPLGRVLGSGSAKEGVDHWWWQRLTAVALVPLGIWFVVAVISLVGAGHAEARAWAAAPVNMVLLIAFTAALLHHAQLGLQVVIEDYVHNEAWKLAGLLAIKFLAALAFIWVVVMLFSAS
ncbi:MAG: succinate dehydrogenase, hydrophobic membrane anchor protein [Gammaproteobacteria bacterium]|nr:succinate dehydrogenase, hydrophobic membrane anchor protein [Gammaproteobacteria bacterium]